MIDPLAEKYPSWSTYNYVVNSPIRFIDPDGRKPDIPPSNLLNAATSDNVTNNAKDFNRHIDNAGSVRIGMNGYGIGAGLKTPVNNFTAKLILAKVTTASNNSIEINAISAEGNATVLGKGVTNQYKVGNLTVDKTGITDGSVVDSNPVLNDFSIDGSYEITADSGPIETTLSVNPSEFSKAVTSAINTVKSLLSNVLNEITNYTFSTSNPQKMDRM